MRTPLIRILLLMTLLHAFAEKQSDGQILGFLGIKKHSAASASEGPQESRKVKQAEAHAEKQKEKDLESYQKAKAEDMKHRFNQQTPETKKRMIESRKKSEEFNNRNHESFFKRLFGKRRR